MLSRVDLPSRNVWKWWLAFFALVAGISSVSFGGRQSEFLTIGIGILASSVSYLWIIKREKDTFYLNLALFVGLVLRLSLLFTFPNLSDDIYRFYWDGGLIINGYSPYGILPVDALGKSDIHRAALFDQLNSQTYYTVYPPAAQVIYALGALTKSVTSCAILMKLMLIAIEAAGVWYASKILDHFGMSRWRILIYYMCPLVIIEGVGNLHFEVIMMSFLVIGFYCFLTGKLIKSASWFALSIGAKLLPLMLLPYIWFRLKGRDRILFFSTLSFILLIIFLPLLSPTALSSMLSSVDLYFRKFEFNASIYFALRWIGNEIFGYNLIQIFGPVLGLTTVGLNIYWAYKLSREFSLRFFHYAAASWTTYLILATTVHPWYVIPLVVFCIWVDRRYVLVWSSLIFLSYTHYDVDFKGHEMVFIGIEYSIVGFMIWNNHLKPIRD